MKPAAPDTLAIAAAMAFIFLAFSFREDYHDVNIVTTLNRAMLYPMPALIFNLFRLAKKEKLPESISDYSVQAPYHA